jgi:hypothetical protein
MTTPHTEMACRLCGLPLNTLGDAANPTYIHPLAAGEPDHQPDPIPATDLHTLARQCDFCGDKHPLWTLIGGDVAAVVLNPAGGGLQQNYGDEWAACATCEHLIHAGRSGAVAERAAAAFPWAEIPQARQRIAKLHEAFLRGLQPGRILITTTAWPAANLQPTDLPKVRDRLTRLYRGADTLPHPPTEQLRHTIADSLERAKLYYIDPQFSDLTERAAAHLPEVFVTDDDPPATDGLLLWSRPITDRLLAAASWTRNSDGLHITCYRHIGTGLDPATLQHVREQVGWLAPTTTIHIGPKSLTEGDPAAPLVTAWLLIAQQIADTTPAELDRAMRKSYARQQRPMPEVRIVRIKPRRARPSNTSTSTGGGRGPMEEREWVEGHWRRVAHGPGYSQHRLKFIKAYVRGPDDKPIRTGTTVRVLGTVRRQRPDPTAAAAGTD